MRVDLVSDAQRESLIDLLCELHAYYNEGALVSRAVVREHLLDNLLSDKSPHHLVVASADDGQVIGLAAITWVYSLVEPQPETRKHCQLKELYVRSAARSSVWAEPSCRGWRATPLNTAAAGSTGPSTH